MTRDLHSAILFCAFLTASNHQLHASACANARPVFSTLFQTQKERKKLRSRGLFDVPGFKDKHVKTSRPAFFDPSYLPHGYKMRYALKSLKRAANSTSNSPMFLHPRVKNSHRHARHPRPETYSGVPSRYINRPILESLLRRRTMSTEAEVRPSSPSSSPPSKLSPKDPLEKPSPGHNRPRKSQSPLNLSRAIQRLDLGRLARDKDINHHLSRFLPILESTTSLLDLSPALQIRLCLALLLSAFQLTNAKSNTSLDTSHLPTAALLVFPQSGPFASTVGLACYASNAVDSTKIESARDRAFYHIANAQLGAFEGRISDAESAIERHSYLKGEVGVESFWLVTQTYRLTFLISTLQRRPLSHSILAILRNSEMSSILLKPQGIPTLQLNREYRSLLQNQIFDALDQIPDLYSWYTQLGPSGLSDPQQAHTALYSAQEHRNLGIIILHYLVNRLHATRSGDSPERADNLIPCLICMLHHFEYFNPPIPDQLIVQCSLELDRYGYSDEATRLLNSISTSSTNAVYQTSARLTMAARRGDVLHALDLVATLRTSRALQKRDIRNLVLAYTRAPVYEIGPMRLGEMDNGSGGVPDSELQQEEKVIPDRMNDAEEIFLRLLAPYGPSLADYVIILDAYARRGDVEKVNSWIERMLDEGFLPDDIPWEKALRAFAVSGNVQGVVRMLDHMQGIHTDNAVSGVDDEGAHQQQHRWSKVMSTSVFNILLELMAKRRDPLSANRLWRNVVSAGIVKPNFNSAVKLLRAHAEAGHWTGVIKAWKYLQSMDNQRQASMAAVESNLHAPSLSAPHHATAVYNTVLRAYVALGMPFPAVMSLFQQMTSNAESGPRVVPDSFTYTMVIISATDSGDMATAKSLFQEMEEQEARRGISSSLPSEHSGRGDGARPRGRSTIDYRPIYALTYLLWGYLRQKQWHSARTIYHLIEKRGLKLLPLTYAVIIKSYAVPGGRGDGDEGLKVAENFLNSLKSGWGNPPHHEGEAPLIKKERPSHDVAAYSPLMVDYVRQRKPEEVERLFEQMVQIGGDVSISGLTMLMDVYRRVGNVEGVRKTWKTVLQVVMDILEKDDLARQVSALGREEGSANPQPPEEDDKPLDLLRMDQYNYPRSSRALLCYPFSVFMDAMSAAGSHEEVALEWKRLRDAGFSFDSHNWNHLVTVLVRAGEVERAFEVVERVIIPFALSSKQLACGTRLGWEMEEKEDDSEGQEVEEMPLVDDDIVRWGRRRTLMKHESNPTRRAALEMVDRQQQLASGSGETSEADFVHELKLMQYFSRNWYQWKPHRSVLRILSKALLHLERGRLVLPLMPSGMVQESREDKVGQAHALLERLHRQYPRTCKLAYDQASGR